MTTTITTTQTLIAQAQTHQQFGRFDQAFADFFHAGQLYFQQNKNDAAADCFRRLLRLETSDIELQLELVRSFLKLNYIEEAAQAFCLCADHFDTLGILDTILSLANELLQTDPDLTPVLDKLIDVLVRDTEIYLSYHLPDQARAGLKRALQYFPQCIQIHQEILKLARKTNDIHGQLTSLLNLAKLTADDRKTAANYLSCALSIADNPDDIYAFGNAIGITLRPQPSITSSLGDEVTETHSNPSLPNTTSTPQAPESAPEDDLSLRQRLARKLKSNATSLKPTPNLPLLLALLRTVEQCQSPTKITIRTPGFISSTSAEIFAQNGLISTNLKLNNQPLSNDYLPGPLLTTTDSTTQQSNRYDILADQLLKITCAFDRLKFEIQQTPIDELIPPPPILSLIKILMTCVGHTAESTSQSLATEFFQTLSAPVIEAAWLFQTNFLDSNLPLPIDAISTGSTPTEMSIESIESISQQLLTDNTVLQTYLPAAERSKPLLTNLISENFALTYLHTPEHVVIIRSTLQNLGRLVTNARQFIDDHEQPITPN